MSRRLASEESGDPLDALDLPRGLPTGALGELEEACFAREYGLMGQRVVFETNDERLLDLATQTYGRYPPADEPAGPPLRIRLFIDLDAPRAPAGSRPRYRTQGHLVYCTLGEGSAMVADLDRGQAFGFLSEDAAESGSMAAVTFIQGMGISLLQAARGYIGLHGACVRKNGVTVLINGSAGAGKSTTAYACLHRGYEFLSEDGLTLQVDGSALTLWGMPWSVHLLPDSARFFPELEGLTPELQHNGEWKLPVDVEARFPSAVRTHAEPGVVAFLDRTASPGGLEIGPMGLRQAIHELGIVWPWQRPWTDEMKRGLVELLDGRAYRLRASGPPDVVVTAIDALVERARRSE